MSVKIIIDSTCAIPSCPATTASIWSLSMSSHNNFEPLL